MEYNYCKFGSFCRFSHEIKEETEYIEEIARKLVEVEKELLKKECIIKSIDLEIEELKKKLNVDMTDINFKNKALEEEIGDLKEKNKCLEEKVEAQVKDFEVFKIDINSRLTEKVENEKVEAENEIESEPFISENETLNSCLKCDFVGKSEVGLKIHVTAKHKTVSSKGYTKITK